MTELIYKEEVYKVIGVCYEVHRILSRGLNEIIYKDALEYEFRKANIPFEREKEYKVWYKDHYLPHSFKADFIAYDKIILEIKAVSSLIDDFVKQTVNYLAISGLELGLLINFGESSLKYKRIILSKDSDANFR